MSNQIQNYKNKNLKVIYSLKLHIQLQNLGFKYLIEMKNPSNPAFLCWVYEDTEAFHNAFDKLLAEGGHRIDAGI